MGHTIPLTIRKAAAVLRSCKDDRAAQIAEFALSLPLLVVFVVGIFDFSGALSLKQKLTNAAREGARVAAAGPANDLTGSSSGVPVSVSDAFQMVDNYLLSEKINDCGLTIQRPSLTAPPLTWSSSATTGCPGFGLTLTINRGFVTTLNATDIVNTQVTIQYPYKWRFNSVITLLVPGARYGSITYISANATAFNEN